MSQHHSRLLSAIGGPDEVIAQLSDGEAATVLRLFESTRREQQRSLDLAIAAALEVLPRLIRVPARKILFGK